MEAEKVIEVLGRSRQINLKKREPLPKEEVYIVGASNEQYACMHYYYGLKYTDHWPEQNSFGGYIAPEGVEPKESAFGWTNTWWTMNVGYSKMNRDFCWVVKDYEDGKILADFLNQADYSDLDSSIKERQNEINRLQEEIHALKKIQEYGKADV